MLPLQNMYLQARQTTPLVRRPAHYNGDISTVTSSRLYVVQSTKVFTNNPHSKNRSLVTDSWCQTVTPSRSPPSDWLRWEREQNSSSPSRCPTATAGGGGAGLHVKAVNMFNYDNTAPDLAYLIYQIMTQLDWGLCLCLSQNIPLYWVSRGVAIEMFYLVLESTTVYGPHRHRTAGPQ